LTQSGFGGGIVGEVLWMCFTPDFGVRRRKVDDGMFRLRGV
jgi:hypothetical protein